MHRIQARASQDTHLCIHFHNKCQLNVPALALALASAVVLALAQLLALALTLALALSILFIRQRQPGHGPRSGSGWTLGPAFDFVAALALALAVNL